jgi:hypothetical protein
MNHVTGAESFPMSRETARKLADRLESGPPFIQSEDELRLIVAALRYYGMPKE